MGLLWHRVKRSDIVEGDHIYTWRALFAYSHHGIYVGQNKVVHFTREQAIEPSNISSLSFSSNSSSSSGLSWSCFNIPDCGFRQHESGVVLSCLDCFLGTGSLYLFKYNVSPLAFFTKLRGGTCTTAESDPQELVIHRTMRLLRKGFGKYNVFMNNCEDFAMYCKTGLLIIDEKAPGRSGQAASIISAPLSAIVSSSVNFFVPSAIVMVTATTGMYCVSRYVADLGVRTDVVKVPAEDMDSLHGWEEKDEEDSEDSKGNKSCNLLEKRAHFINGDPPTKRRRCY